MVMGTLTPSSTRLSREAPMKDVISTSKEDHPSFSFVYTLDDNPMKRLPTITYHGGVSILLTDKSGKNVKRING